MSKDKEEYRLDTGFFEDRYNLMMSNYRKQVYNDILEFLKKWDKNWLFYHTSPVALVITINKFFRLNEDNI